MDHDQENGPKSEGKVKPNASKLKSASFRFVFRFVVHIPFGTNFGSETGIVNG